LALSATSFDASVVWTADVAVVAEVPDAPVVDVVEDVPVDDLDPHPVMTIAKRDAATKIAKDADIDGRWERRR
jgi:hypothetical protein